MTQIHDTWEKADSRPKKITFEYDSLTAVYDVASGELSLNDSAVILTPKGIRELVAVLTAIGRQVPK